MDHKIPALAVLFLLTATPAAAQLDNCVQPTLGFDLFSGSGRYNSLPNGYVYPNGNGNGRYLNGNGFCQSYRRIVLTRSDYEGIRSAPRAVRNRIQANDLMYLCRCEGFRSPLCFTNGR